MFTRILFFILFSLFSVAHAKESVELIIASSPGGSVHRYALHIQPALEKALGKNVVINFKPGGNGLIAARELYNSPKDKLTFLIGNLNLPEVWKENTKQEIVDVRKDIHPFLFLGTIPSMIFSKPTDNFNNFKQAIEYSKKEIVSIAGAANSPNNRLLQQIVSKHNLKDNITLVPFRTGSQALLGVLGGHVTMGVTVLDVLMPEIESGNIKPLAIVYEKRIKNFPNVMTLKEMGISDDSEQKYYNNFFLWVNDNRNEEEINRVRKELFEFLKGDSSEKFLNSLYVQFGSNSIIEPEKYLNKILK